MIDSRFYELAGPFSLGALLEDLDVDPLLNERLYDEMISAPADLASAQPGQISFLSHKKFADSAESSKATACITTARLAPALAKNDIIPIISKTPRAHFARIIEKMVSRAKSGNAKDGDIHTSAQIHATAILGDKVKVGADAVIGPYCVIGGGVTIGARTVLATHISVECADIGSDCVIKSASHIGGEGFGIDGDEKGIVNLPHIGRATLGDRVRMGSNSCVDRGFMGDTEIGNDVKIDNFVQIAHNCRIGDGTMLAGHVGISGSCTIGKNVKMGGAVGIADHLTIGDGAQLAASSGVMNDIPAGEFWGGTPALPAREQLRIIAATRKLIAKKTP
ncbi:MAG: UDP-3-O-(3-hydroxymyristoyl)glucosamine N-acyltransferase [Hellea sp.]|nr:UDP-3-O-(3-hydroxymyristoyl)glucosamine N-acyltransferase [Hellea sp.]